MENNVVLDIIIEFVKAVKGAKKEIVSVVNGKEYKIKAAGYLLGQIIRQYNIPEDLINLLSLVNHYDKEAK